MSAVRLRAGLAALVLHLLLVVPSDPGMLGGKALLVLPLELPLLLLALLAAGQRKGAGGLRAALVLVLVAVTVLKLADLAMIRALSRPFNPVADLPLATAGLNLLAGSAGLWVAVLAAAGAVLAVAGLGVLLWWAAGTWARLTPGGSRAAAAGAVLALGAVLADAGALRPWAPDPPGSAFTTRFGAERLALAQATRAALVRFRAEAAADPLGDAAPLLDRIGRDVIVVFVESYGRTSHDTPFYADLHRATLAAAEARLAAAGLGMASGYLASPTRGGQSWLAHATVANGLWVSDQTRYRAALVSGRQTLFHLARQAGFHTAAVMPQITMDWPESAFMGFDTVLGAADLGYRGKPFNWVTMPDQFTFAALDRLVRQAPGARPHFVQVATGTSHAPWVPVPEMVAWDDIGDGRVFDGMATAGDPPDVVWRDEARIRAQYRLAIDYALQVLTAYAARHAADPPLMIVTGDHQAAGFIALDDRFDVPLHVIGPPALVARAMAWGLAPGLLPPRDSPVLPMEGLRDLIVRSYSSGFGP